MGDQTTKIAINKFRFDSDPTVRSLLLVACESPLAVGTLFCLDQESTVIGRDLDSDIAINDSGISRSHAKILRKDNNHLLTDLGSTNGVFVNGERITEAVLNENDEIALGTTTLLIYRRDNSLDERLLRSQTKLQSNVLELSKLSSVGLLAHGVAHNIRNVLMIVLNHIDLLRMDLVDNNKELAAGIATKDFARLQLLIRHYDQSLADTGVIAEHGARLTEMLRKMSDRGQKGHDTNPHTINLAELLKHELEFLEADSVFKHQIEKDVDLSVPLLVHGIYFDFSQSFINVIKNAVDAMHGCEIKKLTVRTLRKGDQGIIEIRDTGCGINADQLPAIFDPFFTTKRPNGEGPVGTGLGLHMVRFLLAPYGAEITVTSSPGDTCFSISIPDRENLQNKQPKTAPIVS